jgi:hypothetical protein
MLMKRTKNRKSMMNHGMRAGEGLNGVLKGICSLCMVYRIEVGGW